MQNALTIDVEDYYQVSNFERQIRRAEWPQFASRVVDSTERILSALERFNVQATFFVLGYIADRHPSLIRRIDEAGHEIGSHSYWHRLVYEMTPSEFREDLRRSRDTLEDVIGRPVTSFRAPSFSITRRSLWALEILVQEGFRTDSSIFPVRHGRYGIPDAPREPHCYNFAEGELWEFPPTVFPVGKVNVPVSGGGYFRLFPLGITRRLLRRINDGHQRPFVFYVHPWEFDPAQPRLKAGNAFQRFRHYVNLTQTERKFSCLLESFDFTRLDRVLSQYVHLSAARNAATA